MEKSPDSPRGVAVGLTQPQRSEQTRRALIDSAIHVLNERGFNGATAAIIAERAGVTRGAVQHHFGTAQGLFIAVMRHVARARRGPVRPDTAGRGSVASRIRDLIDEYRLLYEGPDGMALLEIWLGAGHDELLRDEVDALMKRITERRVEHWRTVLADIPLSDADIVTLRGVMVSALRGAAIHRSFSRDPAEAARQVRLFVDMAEAWLSRAFESGAPPRSAALE